MIRIRERLKLFCYSIGKLRNSYFKNLKNNSNKFIFKSENLAIDYFKLKFDVLSYINI